MKFRRSSSPEPEINLIPFIDVLLVVLIFLMLSTTDSTFTEIELNLPVANAAPQKERPREIVVSVSADGQFRVNHVAVSGRDVPSISQALAQATQNVKDPMVVVSADAQSTHQSVMMVMEAARRNQLNQFTFAAQAPGGATK